MYKNNFWHQLYNWRCQKLYISQKDLIKTSLLLCSVDGRWPKLVMTTHGQEWRNSVSGLLSWCPVVYRLGRTGHIFSETKKFQKKRTGTPHTGTLRHFITWDYRTHESFGTMFLNFLLAIFSHSNHVALPHFFIGATCTSHVIGFTSLLTWVSLTLGTRAWWRSITCSE